MPGQLVNVAFFSQVEDMNMYLTDYRSSKQNSQQQVYAQQTAHRYNHQLKMNSTQYLNFNSMQQQAAYPQSQNMHQQHQQQTQQINRKKYNNGTTFAQSSNFNVRSRQQVNSGKYNQPYQQSVTSIYNNAVNQYNFPSGLFGGYTSTPNLPYSKSGINQSGDGPFTNDYNDQLLKEGNYDNLSLLSNNSPNVSNSSLGQFNNSVGNISQIPDSRACFSPNSSITPPPIPPSRLSSTLSSASVTSSICNDLDFVLPNEGGNNTHPFVQQQAQQQQQQSRFLSQLPQPSQQSFASFGNQLVEQSFSQDHDLLNSLNQSSSLSTEQHDLHLPYGRNPYQSDTFPSTFLVSQTNAAWNNDNSSRPTTTTSSNSIWNSDMSVWS